MGIPGLASAFLVFLVFVSDLVVIEGGPRGQGLQTEEGGGRRTQGARAPQTQEGGGGREEGGRRHPRMECEWNVNR